MVHNFLSVFRFYHATISSAFVYLLVTLKWRRQACKLLGGARCMLLFITVVRVVVQRRDGPSALDTVAYSGTRVIPTSDWTVTRCALDVYTVPKHVSRHSYWLATVRKLNRMHE